MEGDEEGGDNKRIGDGVEQQSKALFPGFAICHLLFPVVCPSMSPSAPFLPLPSLTLNTPNTATQVTRAFPTALSPQFLPERSCPPSYFTNSLHYLLLIFS